MDWTFLSRLLPEVAIVLVFVWFVERRDRLDRDAREKRDGMWTEFLEKEREATTAVLRALADEVKVMGGTVANRLSAVETAMMIHAAEFREAVAAMRAAVGTRKGDTGPIGKQKE